MTDESSHASASTATPRLDYVPKHIILWSLTTSVCAFLPLITTYLFAISAYFYLGHWPSYGNPDPKQLPGVFVGLMFVCGSSWLLWLPLIPLAACLGAILGKQERDRSLGFWDAVGTIPWTLAAVWSLSVLALSFIGGILALPVVAIVTYFVGLHAWKLANVRNYPSALIYLVGPLVPFAVASFMIYRDPHGAVEWFFD